MSFHVTYNFVQGYDAGQKKIVASEMDQNFADIEGYINNSSVNIAETQTITGDKTFSGDTTFSGDSTFSGNVTLPASAVSGTSVALDGSNVSSIGSALSTYMAHAAMPSGQYIQISPTGGAGTAYTSVADGYISVWFTSTANGAWVSLFSDYVGYQLVIPQSGSQVRLTIPVSKDGRYVANWGSCTLSNFYFTYANGSAPTV